jgi:hypothetical protein
MSISILPGKIGKVARFAFRNVHNNQGGSLTEKGGLTTLFKNKKNRAKQSGGDREARGIFEFGTTVGLRSYPAAVCTQPQPKSIGQSKNNSN